MKPYKQIEIDRKKNYTNQELNTVHRSSLLIPKIEKFSTNISFLNHFLLKRNYKEISLKLSAFDDYGKSSDSVTFTVDKPIVYSFNLEEIFGDSINCFQAEFFSAKNLYIPFPAVMVNHFSEHSINTVHSYNRVLNDLNESDKITSVQVKESSIDISIRNETDTFFLIQSGISEIKNKTLEIKLIDNKNTNKFYKKNINLFMPKMHVKKFILSKIFIQEEFNKVSPGEYTLKIKQPHQEMFYGRIFAAIKSNKYLGFSGNHSYYDSSDFKEYFKLKESFRTFPYFINQKNLIRIYPIMSPGIGLIIIKLNYFENNELLNSNIACEKEFINSKTFLEIDIEELAGKDIKMKKNIKSFTIIYKSKSNHGAPTRVNFQLVYGSKKETSINTSINNSLTSNEKKIFTNKEKYSWCQLVNMKEYYSQIGICFNDKILNKESKNNKISIEIYDEKGLIKNFEIYLKALDSYFINKDDITSQSKFIWIFAKTNKSGLSMYSYNLNTKTLISSGEHSF